MTTIHELNAARGAVETTTFGGTWTVRRELALGRAGQQNAHRGTAGAKLHLLDVEIVVAKPADARPGTFKVGAFSSIRGCVSGNGQFTGVVLDNVTDLDAVTCTRCKARLARLIAAVEGKLNAAAGK